MRTLPLFEPPIDPALLVRARAAGLSIGDVLNDTGATLPKYRFAVMVQKAAEVIGEVRNFGNALLSVLEKRDAEALSTLRAGQELRLLEAVRDIRVKQIEEATANEEALKKGRAIAKEKEEFYANRDDINGLEAAALLLSIGAQIPLGTKAGYVRLAADAPGAPDTRFIDGRMVNDAIVTSSGQNDAGLFEVALRDERYLPFEGAGAISRWQLELATELPMFDHASISDVILHLRYTAKDGGTQLREKAVGALNALLADAANAPLVRCFSLRHEFPSEWRRFVSTGGTGVKTLTVDLARARFPYFSQTRTIAIQRAKTLVVSKAATVPEVSIGPGTDPPDPGVAEWDGQAGPGPWTVSTSADPASIADLLVVVTYSLS